MNKIIHLIFFLLLFISILSWYYHKNGLNYTMWCTEKCPNAIILESKTSPAIGHSPPSGIWTVIPSGRLGNLIGQYSTLYAFAKNNGRQAYILPEMHSKLSKLFQIKLPVLNTDVAKRIPWKDFPIHHNWMSKEYENISGKYVKIYSYPFSWTFYHHLREEILREFTFHDFIREESNSYLAELRGNKTNVTFVGVHVRRGDYVNIMLQSKRGVLASKEYLHDAMEYFRNKYENPMFMVTSNGMDWCKENINNSLGDVYFVGDGKEGSPERDFALLVHCNHTIMTIGTFGIYAAYLTGGETIYLNKFTLPTFHWYPAFKYETVYLPEWIGIPADLSSLLGNKSLH